MDVNRIIREARLTDMAEIMKVMDAAKEIMRQSGNMHQSVEVGHPRGFVLPLGMQHCRAALSAH